MTEYAVVGALAAAALYYVLSPLRRGPRFETSPTEVAVAEAESRKRAALTALLDLETEREVGKLATPEFEVLRAEYEAEAAGALHELDSLGATSAGEDEAVEAEIARIRSQLRS